MSVHINTAKDHDLLAEKPEDILYCSKTAEKPQDETQWVLVHNAEVFPTDRRRMTTDSLLSRSEMSCRVAASDLNGIRPYPDDLWKRVSDGSYWKVVMVDVLSFGNEFQLHNERNRKRGGATP